VCWDVFISSFGLFNDHLSIIDDIKASDKKSYHNICHAINIHAKSGAEHPCYHSVPEQSTHDWADDGTEEEHWSSLGEQCDGSEASKNDSGDSNGLHKDLWGKLIQVVDKWSNKESHEKGKGPEVSNSLVFWKINVCNFVHHVSHTDDGYELHEEAREDSVGVHVHT